MNWSHLTLKSQGKIRYGRKYRRKDRRRRARREEEDVSSYWMTLRKGMILETERADARSHSVEN